jgi:hypothetical protein
LNTVNLLLSTLQTDRHDRTGFDCGLEPVNQFLREQARRQMEQRINRTWVLTDADTAEQSPCPILGYFTLTHGTVQRAELPAEKSLARLPLYPLPVIKLAWLGVARGQQRGAMRVGESLLLEALHTARRIVEHTGLGIAVVTDPLTDASESFFCKYGFVPMEREFGERRSLFMGMKTVQQLW